ncbi:MAG: glutamate-cysteine ligase family protein [Gammaproteobacteria bacterium]
MGDEISHSRFSDAEFAAFRAQLAEETRTLQHWFADGVLSRDPQCTGFELESWLVDAEGLPAPLNQAFLQRLDSPLASPELAAFNVEVNSVPRVLQGHVFTAMHNELNATWRQCRQVAAELETQLVMVGILPTVENDMLNLANMSSMERYRALNREVFHQRHGKPLTLDIVGKEHLHVTHRDVMLESAATSFQIHLQVDPRDAVRLFNASTIVSAPMVALAANSPFLFGKNLWHETRIPLFEQAVAVGGYAGAAFGPIRRVSFGSAYVRASLFECFSENLQHYPVMLPVDLSTAAQPLPHLRLHNGTIWRWNRPLLGFDAAGQPHLRIEHRVVPAGPTVIDAIANAAFFYGLVNAVATQAVPAEQQLCFEYARDNFYEAARFGLGAQLRWFDGRRWPVRELILEQLLPLAAAGLQAHDVAAADIGEYLGIIRERVSTRQNGAQWQQAFVDKHGRDMRALLAAYLERQNSGEPVHQWTL